ncbi:MAG: hypothetical protein ABSC18_11170 [Verrucomicrobiota bacterium]|jgi:hypothetical protein
MFAHLRHWAGAGAVFAGLALGVLAAPGYLPAVGPVPLRFRPDAQPATNLIRMPLPPPDPPSTNLPDFSAPSVPSAASAKPAPALPAAALPATNTPAGADATPSASEPRISPQMLLRYFNRSTNGAAGGILAPVDFAPPAAAAPPSSTATYSTEPK